jgi:preprotein translocase subunit SecE
MDKVKLIVQKIKDFLKEAQIELKKVTWPTPKQTVASTGVVIIVVIIISIFLGIVDFGLAKMIRLVLG